MTTAPVNSVRAARAVVQRDRLARVIARCGLTLGAAGAATVLMVAGDRVWGWGLPWWTLPIPTALAAVAGVAWGLAAQERLLAAATRLDAALGWHDRIASAIGFAERSAEPDPFVTLAVADAEKRAPEARADRAVPIIWGHGWSVWAGALALAVAGFLFLPSAATGGPGGPNALDRERQAAAIVQIEEAERALAELEDDTRPDETVAGATDEDLAAFDDLKRALEDNADPREALAEAAERIDKAADRLDQRAGDAAATEEALRETLDETLNEPGAMDERAREMVERLREGDLAGARRAAQEMLGNADELDAEQRERLAQNLDDLARALEQRANDATPGDAESAPESVDDLAQRLQEEQNLTEQAARDAAERELERQRRERAEREAAEDAQRLSDAMRRTAEDLRQPPGETEGQNQASEGQQGEQTEGDAQGQQPSGDPGGNQPGDTGERSDQPGEQPGDRQGDGRDPSRTPGEQASPDDQGQPAGGRESQDPSGRSPQDSTDPTSPSAAQGDRGEQGSPSDPDGREAGTPEETPEGGSSSPDAQQGEVDQGQRSEGDPQQGGESQQGQSEGQQPGEQPGQEQGQQPGQQQGQPGEQQPSQQEGQPEGGAQGGEPAPDQQAQDQQQGDPGAGAKPDSSGGGEGEGQAPPQAGSDQGPEGDQPGQPGQQGRDSSGESPEGGNSDRDSGGDGSGVGSGEQLFRELDRLRERNEGATRDREQAERLRQQARKMLDEASPEERERLEDLARQYADRLREQKSGDPFEEQVFDARARDGSPEVRGTEEQRANLLEDEPGQGGPATGGPPMTGERVRNAAQSAERAIEQQGVPRRYRDLVRDVFRRYQKTVQEQEPGFAPLGTDATRDSGSGGGGGGGGGDGGGGGGGDGG